MPTTNPNVAMTYLKYILTQLAAEAIRLDEVVNGTLLLKDALLTGNKRSSIFTEVQAKWFADHFKVVAHQANTPTGFSGTLFECTTADPSMGLVAGEQIMSFRSTEFADDAVRDNQQNNSVELHDHGWAFGQIADMEQWYASLKSQGKINGQIGVTGYRLGGQFARAFNLLYGNTSVVAGTYSFKAAVVSESEKHPPALMRLSSHFGLKKSMDIGGWQKQVYKKARREHSHFAVHANAGIHVTHGVTSRVYEPDPLGELNADCSNCSAATGFDYPPALMRLSWQFGLKKPMDAGICLAQHSYNRPAPNAHRPCSTNGATPWKN